MGPTAPAAPAALTPRPPPALACLERLYGVGVQFSDGSWWARVGEARLAYDDGRTKGAAEKLERPDLEDTFWPRYAIGPVHPVTSPGQDPGRARVDALFRFAYPARELVRVDFAGHAVRVQRKVAPAFARVSARLATLVAADASLAPFVAKLGGSFNARNIAGTDRPSAHSYGIAIDLNPDLSSYWRWDKSGWKNRIPQAIVDAFEAEGFIWGGRWFHFDTMHFEYRPELLDGRCYASP